MRIASLEKELETQTNSENYDEAEVISQTLNEEVENLQEIEEQIQMKLNLLVKVAKERNKLDQITVMDAKVKKCRKELNLPTIVGKTDEIESDAVGEAESEGESEEFDFEGDYEGAEESLGTSKIQLQDGNDVDQNEEPEITIKKAKKSMEKMLKKKLTSIQEDAENELGESQFRSKVETEKVDEEVKENVDEEVKDDVDEKVEENQVDEDKNNPFADDDSHNNDMQDSNNKIEISDHTSPEQVTPQEEASNTQTKDTEEIKKMDKSREEFSPIPIPELQVKEESYYLTLDVNKVDLSKSVSLPPKSNSLDANASKHD